VIIWYRVAPGDKESAEIVLKTLWFCRGCGSEAAMLKRAWLFRDYDSPETDLERVGLFGGTGRVTNPTQVLLLNHEEQMCLACMLFTNNWLKRRAPDFLKVPGDVKQYIMEEGRKVVYELGLIVRGAVGSFQRQLPRAVRDRVKDEHAGRIS
jgi:hypothetical protein